MERACSGDVRVKVYLRASASYHFGTEWPWVVLEDPVSQLPARPRMN